MRKLRKAGIGCLSLIGLLVLFLTCRTLLASRRQIIRPLSPEEEWIVAVAAENTKAQFEGTWRWARPRLVVERIERRPDGEWTVVFAGYIPKLPFGPHLSAGVRLDSQGGVKWGSIRLYGRLPAEYHH